MSEFQKGARVYEKLAPQLGCGEVLYQCGAGGIQSPGSEPLGHDVTVVRWEDGDFTERLPTETLALSDI